MITILEPDGTVRYQSPAVELVLGYKLEGLVCKNPPTCSKSNSTTKPSTIP